MANKYDGEAHYKNRPMECREYQDALARLLRKREYVDPSKLKAALDVLEKLWRIASRADELLAFEEIHQSGLAARLRARIRKDSVKVDEMLEYLKGED